MSGMSLACALCGNFWALFACRFVQGIGVGGETPIAACYISELSIAKGRGKYFLIYELIFPVGMMVTGQLGTWLVPLFGWKILFWIGALPGFVVSYLVWRLPESPRWLIGKKRFAEAEVIVRQMEASTTARITPTVKVRTAAATAAAAVAPVKYRAGWLELIGTVYRKRTLIVWTLWVCAFFVSNSLNNWLPTLYRTVYHLPLRDALRFASFTNIAQVALLFVCAYCIDRVGRRNWTITMFVLGGCLLLQLGLFGTENIWNVVIVTSLSYGLIGSIATVLYLYTPEVYPTRMRAMGTGIASSWLRLASAVGPAVVGLLVHKDGVVSVFLMFTGVSLVGMLAATLMTETRERTLEEIAP
jgi:putative MFS transporter